METRVCRGCALPRPIGQFEPIAGKPYRRRLCNTCAWPEKKGRTTPAKLNEWKRNWRINNVGAAILEDCRGSDRKSGLICDLTREFIETTIVEGCRYCGETDLRMTLDRIDNSQGHTQTNVVPCCYRCNLIRDSMPYEAWQVLVPAVRKAKEGGLFGSWRSKPIRRT